MEKRISKTKRGLVAALAVAGLLTAAPAAFAAGTPAGTEITNVATMPYSDEGGNSFTATSNTIFITVATVAGVSASCSADQTIKGGEKAYYACTVTNSGNNSNTFSLSVLPDVALAPWGYLRILADDGLAGGTPNDSIHTSGETTGVNTTGAMVADSLYYFFVEVEAINNTPNGSSGAFTLTVSDGATASTTVSKTTTISAPATTLVKYWRNVTAAGAFSQTSGVAPPGDVVEYQVKINNAGSATMTSAVLSDVLDANTTFEAGSIWAGTNATTYNGAGNVNLTDNTTGDSCATELCATANYNSGTKTVTAYVGNGATETAAGTFSAGSTMYIYFRAKIN